MDPMLTSCRAGLKGYVDDAHDAVQIIQNLQRKKKTGSTINNLPIGLRSQEIKPVRQVGLSASDNEHPTINQNKARSKREDEAESPGIDAFGYLQRFGYVNATIGSSSLISEKIYMDAIKSFQQLAGIAQTGTVDSETVKFMGMSRCGNKDVTSKGEKQMILSRKKRYVLQGSKWRRLVLTYRISEYPKKFLSKKHEVDRQMDKAFKYWSQVTPIDFVAKQDGRVNMDIRFASGDHGDGIPFDGLGHTLAHAFYPKFGGAAHFDDQEDWSLDSPTGTDMLQVAVHEIGHALGLDHSQSKEAVMGPFYTGYKPKLKLHRDDKLGIQALYGERNS